MDLTPVFRKVYGEKTIQQAWKFLVSFDDYTPAGSKNQEKPPIVEEYHVRAVTIPNYRFRKEVMDYNNLGKTFPIFDSKAGLDLRIEFDEDAAGRCARLVRYLQRRIMNQDGTYRAPNEAKLNRIRVDIISNSGDVTTRYWFHGCYLLEAEDYIFSYDSSENIKFVVTFAVDYVTVEPVPDFKGG
jgi:hypothetical protein